MAFMNEEELKDDLRWYKNQDGKEKTGEWVVENGDAYHYGEGKIDNSSQVASLERKLEILEEEESRKIEAKQLDLKVEQSERIKKMDMDSKERLEKVEREKTKKEREEKIKKYEFDKIVVTYKAQTCAPVRMIRFIFGKGLKKETLKTKNKEELELIMNVLYGGFALRHGQFHGMKSNNNRSNRIDESNVKAFKYLVTNKDAMNEYLRLVEKEDGSKGVRR